MISQVVGCIPYRYKNGANNEEGLEVLMISAQKGEKWLFPKGGWETVESKEDAAARETFEQAGVQGSVEYELGKWTFKSRNYGTPYEGSMFSMFVERELNSWPEKDFQTRRWMTIGEAKEICNHVWMKEALDRLGMGRRQLQRYKEASTGCRQVASCGSMSSSVDIADAEAFPELRKRYGINRNMGIKRRNDRFDEPEEPDGTIIMEGYLQSGLRLPMSDFLISIFNYYGKAPCQFTGNFYRLMNMFENLIDQGYEISAEEVAAHYFIKRTGKLEHTYTLAKRAGKLNVCTLPGKDNYLHKSVFEIWGAISRRTLLYKSANTTWDECSNKLQGRVKQAIEIERFAALAPVVKRKLLPSFSKLFLDPVEPIEQPKTQRMSDAREGGCDLLSKEKRKTIMTVEQPNLDIVGEKTKGIMPANEEAGQAFTVRSGEKMVFKGKQEEIAEMEEKSPFEPSFILGKKLKFEEEFENKLIEEKGDFKNKFDKYHDIYKTTDIKKKEEMFPWDIEKKNVNDTTRKWNDSADVQAEVVSANKISNQHAQPYPGFQELVAKDDTVRDDEVAKDDGENEKEKEQELIEIAADTLLKLKYAKNESVFK